ncbi:hypothetical protein IAR50_004092 [Cryptococcus sp. DSM 104548]
MAPKRQASASVASPAKKSKGPSGNQQQTLASFFASPSKTGASKPNDSEIITIDDSDDDTSPVPPTKKLAAAKELSRKQAASSSKPKSEDTQPERVSDKISSSNEPINLLGDEDEEIKPFAESSRRTHPSNPSASVPKKKTPAFPKTTVVASENGDTVHPLEFDSDPFTFLPSSIDTTHWPKGRLPYSILVGVYVQVSGTRSRLAIIRIITNFLHLVMHASPVDLPSSLYLLSNHLAPSYVPCDLGIGPQIISKAMQEVSGLQPRDLKRLYQKYGDPGDVAFEAKTNLRTLIKPAPLLAADVYEKLIGLSKVKGASSGKVKGDVVRKLMVQARGEEVRFLVRSMIGNLRIGAVKLTLLTALARATTLLHLPEDLRSTILPLSTDGKGKRSTKVKPETDPSREAAEQLCLSAIGVVRKAYVRHPNYAHLIKGLESGVGGLEERVPVTVGIPLSPMLGSITRSLNEVFTRLGKLPFTAEAKLDGQRVQCHVRLEGPQGEDDGGGRWVVGDTGEKIWVRLFSRHLDDMTEKYPDVCQLLLRLLKRPLPAERSPFLSSTLTESQPVLDLLKAEKMTSFIIDAEIVAIDKDTGAFKTFQELSNRAKKDVREEDIKVIVGVYAFDLMVLNDVPLLGSSFSHRRHLMRTFLPPLTPTIDSPKSSLIAARFNHVESVDSTKFEDAPAELQAFFEKVVENKCEGLMVKLLESGEGLEGEDAEGGVEDEEGEKDVKRKSGNRKPLPATYEPDQRSQGWLKVKKDYLEGLGDSLDLVPIGAWWGNGRKAGWWSPILLACHNPESGALEAVCKCMSGFSDAFYKDLTKRYPAEGMPEKCNKTVPLGYVDTNGLTPDVWFDPSEVWEIRGADITLSPVYPAASSALGSERGLSVRFPRFMKIREDKTWEEATTSEQFAEMYRKQMETKPEAAEDEGEDKDV